MLKWMVDCRAITRIVSDSLDRQLPFKDRAALRIHLMMCRHCSRFREQLVMITSALQCDDMSAEERHTCKGLPPEIKDHIKDVLKEHIQRSSNNGNSAHD